MASAAPQNLSISAYRALVKSSKRQASMQALGRLKQGEQNKTEIAYEERVLKPAMQAGEILWYQFEPISLKLAKNTYYRPDYMVLTKARELEVHEVKGFWTDDARAKTKIAAALFPFRFIAVRRAKKSEGGGWAIEEF